jgi:16S rRNA (uracil1498-N3)-methyltransferase
MSDTHKLPRLFMDLPFEKDADLPLTENAHHYVRNVMRMEEGQSIRLFNGRDGEFVGNLTSLGKKHGIVRLAQHIKQQPVAEKEIHLLFTPLRKERMDWLVEKSVELGVTHLHPVLTQNTDMRKINDERIQAQIIEAAEQCERMDIPSLSPMTELFDLFRTWSKESQIYAALERYEAPRLSEISSIRDKNTLAILIGPAGGFTQEEMERIVSQEFVSAISLGDNILRAETAAIAALSLVTI